MFITNENNKIINTGTFKNTELKHTNITEPSKVEIESNIQSARALTSKETFEYALDIEQIIQLSNVASHSSGDYVVSDRNQYRSFKAALKHNTFNFAKMDINGMEGSLIFDLNDNNRIDYGGENLNIKSLFALDDNRDGILDESDEYFDKLKIVFTDNNSENKMVKLSSVVNFINLEDYIDKSYVRSYKERGMNNSVLKYIDPIYTHDKYNSSTVDSMIDKFANEDGWLEFNDDTAVFMANLAYKKEDVNGGDYLQKVNTQSVAYKLNNIGENGGNAHNGKGGFLHSYYGDSYHHTDDLPGFSTYMKSTEENGVKFTTLDDVNAENLNYVQKDRFDNIYNEYHKLIDTNANQREFRKYEKEFERITNLDFSKENLEKVKLEVDSGNLTDTFKDMDSLVAIKKDGNGGYILKFDTDVCVGNSSYDAFHPSVDAFKLTPQADYYNNTPVQLNSFGGWIYLESQNPMIGSCQLTQRYFTVSNSLKVFDVSITADRKLSVAGSITQWSSTSITTIDAIPQDEWIYISAYQSGKSYQVGWRRADLTGDTQVGSIYPDFALDLTPNVYNFPMDGDCLQKASHLFWQPGVAMFDNMFQRDLSAMEIHGSIGLELDLLNGPLVQDITDLLFGLPSPVTFNDIDVCFGTAEGVIVDLRNRTCSAFDAPPLN